MDIELLNRQDKQQDKQSLCPFNRRKFTQKKGIVFNSPSLYIVLQYLKSINHS